MVLVTPDVRRWVVERGKRRKMLKALREQRLRKRLRHIKRLVIAPERVAIDVWVGPSTAAFMPPEAVEQRLSDIDDVREIARQAKAWYRGQESPWLGCHLAVRGWDGSLSASEAHA